MENNINQRIADLVKSLKMSTNAFAKTISKSQSAVSFIIEGRSKPGFEVLDAICEVHKVNPSWLLTGKGEMWDSLAVEKPATDMYLQDYLVKLEAQFERVLSQLEKKDQQLETKDHQLESKDSQIQSLQEMLKMQLGKYEGVMKLTSRDIMPLYPELEMEA